MLQASFIGPIEIINYVFPMVLMKKINGKFRMCIDYQILNKNTQNDHFPLSFINTTLDEVTGHELYTFMNGHLKYN